MRSHAHRDGWCFFFLSLLANESLLLQRYFLALIDYLHIHAYCSPKYSTKKSRGGIALAPSPQGVPARSTLRRKRCGAAAAAATEAELSLGVPAVRRPALGSPSKPKELACTAKRAIIDKSHVSAFEKLRFSASLMLPVKYARPRGWMVHARVSGRLAFYK